jgi:hypothetical protein
LEERGARRSLAGFSILHKYSKVVWSCEEGSDTLVSLTMMTYVFYFYNILP